MGSISGPGMMAAAAPTGTGAGASSLPVPRHCAACPVPAPRNAGDFSSSVLLTRSTTVHHVFEIQGYSWMSQSLRDGEGLTSRSFNAGAGTTWHIRFFPNGNGGFVSLRAVLDRAHFVVKAKIGFDMLDLSGETVPRYARTGDVVLEFASAGAHWGYADFIKRQDLERDFLKDDRFSVRCSVTVIEFLAGAPAPPRRGLPVPPPDWTQHFRHLLLSGHGADVSFQVGEEVFAAHRCVLAARSPVFKAELYGAMKESSAEHCVRVDGIRPEVFTYLLHFAYTDELPPSETEEEEDDDDAAIAMAQHLMVAADRYGMDRLKLVCEDTLCRHITVSTVATTLALAEQHLRLRLKEACFEFLLESPATPDAVMATQGFDHLAKSCPSLLKELVSKLAAARSPNLSQEALPPSKKHKTLPPGH